MLTLNLIRHAKTNQNSPTGKDFDRELLPKGLAQANLLGTYVNTQQINLGKIFCSSAVRTKQTLSILNQLLINKEHSEYMNDLYLAGSMELLALIEQNAKDHSVITVIGHNEGISELASYLVDDYLVLRTCELISIELPISDWSELARGIGMVKLQYRPDVFLP